MMLLTLPTKTLEQDEDELWFIFIFFQKKVKKNLISSYYNTKGEAAKVEYIFLRFSCQATWQGPLYICFIIYYIYVFPQQLRRARESTLKSCFFFE